MTEELPIKYVKDKDGRFIPITSPSAVINSDGKNINEMFVSYRKGATAEVEINELLEKVYPIGSIYMSTENVSPASFLGGTWEQIKDAFLWSSGDTTSFTYTENEISVTKYLTAGSSGGEIAHTLTVDEMPNHRHNVKQVHSNSTYAGDTKASVDPTETSTKGYNKETTSTGGGLAHNNMPPYLAVYMWKRIP